MGLEGRRRCIAQFEWRACADKLDAVYREMLRQRHAGRPPGLARSILPGAEGPSPEPWPAVWVRDQKR